MKFRLLKHPYKNSIAEIELLTLNNVTDMSTSWGFDFWQSTERLYCTGATLLLVLRATCCFNEV